MQFLVSAGLAQAAAKYATPQVTLTPCLPRIHSHPHVSLLPTSISFSKKVGRRFQARVSATSCPALSCKLFHADAHSPVIHRSIQTRHPRVHAFLHCTGLCAAEHATSSLEQCARTQQPPCLCLIPACRSCGWGGRCRRGTIVLLVLWYYCAAWYTLVVILHCKHFPSELVKALSLPQGSRGWL